ncbi:hypothetical protein EROM_020290 [Encephalitozoon romaleae SJ-2008]|uniref:Uncharacterized protein n=1 Tax=Encephalitozoon romaleae (strain SJ-2008) TaxID=1178016 RepID=I7ALF5_ENCRO|nr:hypothetical protein EROM_020290 [Encephalitozoon romaleae SJ-2008]AFN82504.1 hypothetical protein EROM_020290 [Encephalitozoon romaleae SJ-2008]
MNLQANKRTCIFLHTISTMITIFSMAYEKKSFLKNVQNEIEIRKLMIDQELYTELLSRIADGNYLVTQKGSKLFRYLKDTNILPGIYLVGSRGRQEHVSLEKVPYLDPRAKYFFIDIKDIPLYRMFLKNNLRSFIHTKGFDLDHTENEILQMSRISQECLRILDRIGSTKIVMEDMIVKLNKGNPDELCIEHSQGLFITKSLFNNRNEFLEDLKTHFVGFMDLIPFGMKTSSFCSAYAKSVINYLKRENVLLLSPSIKRYPELIHYLFPYRIISGTSNLSSNQLVVGGVSFNGIHQNDYLKELFDLEKIKKITENGVKFIFTAHVSIDSRKRKYGISFI